MSAIRSADTKPELLLRSGLHAMGFRFRLHDKRLSGRPDLVFPRFRAALFVQGCFWHGHECPAFRWPSTRRDFWKTKIETNRARDLRNLTELHASGWRCAVVWTCALTGRYRHDRAAVLGRIAAWLRAGQDDLKVEGQRDA